MNNINKIFNVYLRFIKRAIFVKIACAIISLWDNY